MELTNTPAHNEVRERLRRTLDEYIRLDAELRALEDTNYRVCIFGSARIRPQDPTYHAVFNLAQQLSERGVDVVTGGGPGLMEAANRGVLAAKRRRAKSYGLPLDLPTLVEPANRHLDVKSAHQRFSSRLDEFIRLSHAVVVAPGGIGTLLELMYVWQLLQLNTIEKRPLILLGRDYWDGFLKWMQQIPAERRLIDARDLASVSVVDEPEEALAILDGSYAAFLAARRPVLADVERETPAETLEHALEHVTETMEAHVEAAEETLEELALAA